MSGLSAADRIRLQAFLDQLRDKRRRHTELVSVYIPAGYDLNKIIQHLQEEYGTASNIKSSTTRKNVQDALERMIQHLKLFKRTPEHGLAVFSGNIAEQEGVSDVEVYSIEPPIPLKTRIYRCDKQFVLQPLEEMLEDKTMYGLVVIDRRDAVIGLLKGKTIIPLVKTHSEVPGKFRAGGQSAQRFARLREGAAKDHYRKVAEYMKEQFMPILQDLRGIIIGGPGHTKYEFVEGNHITDQVKQKIIAVKDITYTDEFGLQELVDKAQDVLASEAIAEEKKALNEFFRLLAKDPGRTAYGKREVEQRLQEGVVDTLLLSEHVPQDEAKRLAEIAEQYGSRVIVASSETREGAQLHQLGGYAAILRYRVE